MEQSMQVLEWQAEARKAGKAEGKAEGEAKGKAEGKMEVAKRLLAKGMKIEDVADVTGLSIKEIKEL